MARIFAVTVLAAVLVFAACSEYGGGKYTLTVPRGQVRKDVFKLEDPTTGSPVHRLIIHVMGTMVQNLKVTVGSSYSGGKCSGSVSGVSSNTITPVGGQAVVEVVSSTKVVYVCTEGEALPYSGEEAELNVTAFLSAMINYTNVNASPMRMEHASRDVPDEGHFYQFAVPLCGLFEGKVGDKTMKFVPLELKNIRLLSQPNTNIDTNLKNSADAIRKDFEEILNDWTTITVSQVRSTIADPTDSSYTFKAYRFTELYDDFSNTGKVYFYLPISDYTDEKSVVFVNFHMKHCNATYGFCPEKFKWEVNIRSDSTTVLLQNRRIVPLDKKPTLGTTLPMLDEVQKLNIHAVSWCPFIFRNNLEYDPPAGVTPEPKRYILWSDRYNSPLKSKDKLAVYATIVKSNSKVKEWDEMTELPSRANYTASQTMKFNYSSQKGYAIARSDPTIAFSLDAASSSGARALYNSTYSIYLRAMVGYLLYEATIMNTTQSYSSWDKYALNVAQGFLERLDKTSVAEGDQICVTYQCDAAEADCIPVLVYQDAEATKKEVTSTGYFTQVEGKLGSSTFCFEKGVTETDKHGFLLPMNGSSHEWISVSTPVKVHVDEVKKSTAEVTATGFTTDKIYRKTRANIDGQNKVTGIIRVPMTAELFAALTDDKQLTLTPTVFNDLDEPQVPMGWSIDIRASQLCPRAGDTCMSLVSKVTEDEKEKLAIASASLKKELKDDKPKLPSLFIAVVVDQEPDSVDYSYFKVTAKVEDKAKGTDVIDGGDGGDGDDIIDIPDNDNNTEKPEPVDETNKTPEEPDDRFSLMKKYGPLALLYWIIIGGGVILLLVAFVCISKCKKRGSGAGKNNFWSVVDAGETALA